MRNSGGKHLSHSQHRVLPWIAGILAVVLAGGGGFLWFSTAPPGGGGRPVMAPVTPSPAISASPAPTAEPIPEPTPMPPPTPVPTTAPDPMAARAQEIMDGMTGYEKLCQLFIVYQDQLTGVSPTTASGPKSKAAIEKYPVAGVIYNSANLQSPDQAWDLIAGIQSYSKLGLFISADQEGGAVARLAKGLGVTKFNPMYTYKDEGAAVARSNAATLASDMAAFNFNLDFAPVADVWSNPENTVIGKRAYSDDFAQAAELVSAAVEGFHAGGVACVLKHFPGHGNTSEDSHSGVAYVNRTVEELEANEWVPFRAGIAAGADMVMVGHLTVPAIDDVPATLSEKLVTGYLRGELGYGGVVITDALEMGAITKVYTPGEIAEKAVNAGIDLLLCPQNLDAALKGLQDALDAGRLSQERVNESVLRILLLKLERGIIV